MKPNSMSHAQARKALAAKDVEIDQLRQEVERLRLALEPFAIAYRRWVAAGERGDKSILVSAFEHASETLARKH